jgi:hypothetical protein
MGDAGIPVPRVLIVGILQTYIISIIRQKAKNKALRHRPEGFLRKGEKDWENLFFDLAG